MGYDPLMPAKVTIQTADPTLNGTELFWDSEREQYYDEGYHYGAVPGTTWLLQFDEANVGTLSGGGNCKVPPAGFFTPSYAGSIPEDLSMIFSTFLKVESSEPGISGVYTPQSNTCYLYKPVWESESGAKIVLFNNVLGTHYFILETAEEVQIDRTATDSAKSVLDFIPASSVMTWNDSGTVVTIYDPVNRRYFENKQQKQGTSPYIAVKTVTE